MNLELRRISSEQTEASPQQIWQPRRGTLRVRLFVYFVLLDSLCLLASFGVAPLLHNASYSESRLGVVLAVMVPAYLMIALNSGAYSAELIRDRYVAMSRGLRSFALALGFVILAAFCLKATANFSRLTMSIGALLSIVSIATARFLFAKHATAILGGNPFSVILLCDGDQPIPPGDYSVVIASDANFDPDRHDPDMYDRLAKALEGADRVVVMCGLARRLSWANALKGANIQSEIVVPELGALAPLGVGRHGKLSTVIVSNGPLKLTDRVMKRAFDTGVAALAVVFFSPVLLITALLVKLDSKGPVFFRQTRIGRGNEMFEVLKFRSMASEYCDDKGDRSTSRNDERITRIGRFIRMTSIDELPQLFNVLRGDMSIVGPRPHALGSRAEDKLFWEIDERYWHRHAAKPGLTGLAQIRGYRGATLHEHDLVNRLQADLEYLDHWSIWKDLKIIAQTFRVLLHRNAY